MGTGVTRGRQTGGYRLGSGQRKPALEDCQAAEQDLLGIAEEMVTPGNRCPHRPLSLGLVAWATGEQWEDAVKPLEHGSRGEHVCAGRRKFNSQRETIQACTDSLDDCGCVIWNRGIRLKWLRPALEEPHRLSGIERRDGYVMFK